VCEAREDGGLRIIDLRTFNLALLGKWVWRLGSDKGGLWKEIIVSKYGGWRSLREEGKDNKESIWWKDLRKVWNSKDWGRNFEDSINWKVGYGKKVLFWEDNWVGSGTLKNVFSRLFSLSLSKDSAVTTFRGWNYGKWDWNFVWRRNLFEWEKQIVVLFSQAVQGASFDLDKEDRWEWKEGEKLGYTVKSAYLPSKGGQSWREWDGV